MFKRILVAVDGSACGGKALAGALKIAKETGARVRLVHVLENLLAPDPDKLSGRHSEALALAQHDEAERVLGAARSLAQAAGVDADTMLYDRHGHRLGEVVAEAAKLWNADVVVVGTHGRRGLGRLLLGSGADAVVRLAPVPVLVFR